MASVKRTLSHLLVICLCLMVIFQSDKSETGSLPLHRHKQAHSRAMQTRSTTLDKAGLIQSERNGLGMNAKNFGCVLLIIVHLMLCVCVCYAFAVDRNAISDMCVWKFIYEMVTRHGIKTTAVPFTYAHTYTRTQTDINFNIQFLILNL